METVSFLSCKSMPFLFLVLLCCLGPPVRHQIEVVRVNILALFPVLGERIESFAIKCNVRCRVIVDTFYQVVEVPFYS